MSSICLRKTLRAYFAKPPPCCCAGVPQAFLSFVHQAHHSWKTARSLVAHISLF